MAPLRTWWEDTDRALIQYYYEHILKGEGIAPHQCPASLAERIIARHLSSPSMFALFLLPDLLAIDQDLRRADHRAERINDPAIPHFRWNSRLHLTLENLQSHHAFTEKVRTLVEQANRII